MDFISFHVEGGFPKLMRTSLSNVE